MYLWLSLAYFILSWLNYLWCNVPFLECDWNMSSNDLASIFASEHRFLSLKCFAAKSGGGKLCPLFELSICYLFKYSAVLTIYLRGKKG